MSYYIGIDVGTSATKSVVFDIHGHAVYSASSEYDIITPQIGYAEERPEDWARAAINTLKEISKTKFASEIKGIGLAGQMHGLVLLDKNDRILRNSIIWCDNRASKQTKDIEEVLGREKIKRITGNYPMQAFTLAKLLWVKDNEPNIYNNIAKVMLPKDYLKYVITKEFTTEFSDASGMQMVDLKSKSYSKAILSAFDIPEEWLPKISESADIIGSLSKEMENETGLKNVFVVGGAGDQAAGAIANNVIEPGDISISLGSSGVVFAPVAVYDDKASVQTFMHAAKDTYHIMGVTNACGTSLKWFKNTFCKDLSYDEILKMASQVEAGSNGVIFLPYIMGERTPHLDEYATGIFFGIRSDTKLADLARAVIEGICFSLLDCYNLINGNKINVFVNGGGSKGALWLTILASVLNINIKKLSCDESTALGGAILAMVADEQYASIKEACNHICGECKDDYHPNEKWIDVYERLYPIYKRLYIQNKDLYKEMNNVMKGKE